MEDYMKACKGLLACMHERLDAGMHGCLDGWTDGWMRGCCTVMQGWKDERMDGPTRLSEP